jgi:large subunit ribosomal protein L6
MSRIGKKPIPIPEDVKVFLKDEKIVVEGPLGKLEREIFKELEVKIDDGKIFVLPKIETKKTKALWGLLRSLISNMIEGVKNGFEKKLEIHGVGYSAKIEKENLVLNLGFAHPVIIPIPKDLKISVDKNVISIFGIEKEKVGNFAAKIRSVRPPDSYKGKGIRYFGEKILLKPGKRGLGSK